MQALTPDPSPRGKQGKRERKATWRRCWRRAVRLMLGLLGATIALLIAAPHWLPLLVGWLAMPTRLPNGPVDAIVVFGGDTGRTLHAVQLFEQGYAPRLWLTGWNEREFRPTSIPDTALRFIPSTSTWDDATQIATLAREAHLHQLLVVTDWFHSRRALYSLEHQLQGSDITLFYSPSAGPAAVATSWWSYPPAFRWLLLSELGKLVFYGLRYGLPFFGSVYGPLLAKP